MFRWISKLKIGLSWEYSRGNSRISPIQKILGYQRWVAPSALPSLGCVTAVKRYKSVHKNPSENKQNVIFVPFFLQKLVCPNLKIDIPDCPDHLTPTRFHRRFQECRLHKHEFFGPSKWPIKYLARFIYPINSEIFAFFLQKLKKVGTSKTIFRTFLTT